MTVKTSFVDDMEYVGDSKFVIIQAMMNFDVYRRSHPGVFCKKRVLKNFAKFMGKHLCQRLFFNKVAGLKPVILLKKSLWHRCFPVNFGKFSRTPFLKEYLWWLLLCSEYKTIWLYVLIMSRMRFRVNPTATGLEPTTT